MTIRRFAFILAAGAVLALAVADIPAAQAGGKSGGGQGMKSGMGHTGVPRPSGNSLGGKPLAGKGADIGQANPSGGMNNPVGSRRDRRGQPQPQANVGKGPKPTIRLGEHCLPHARPCRKFAPYQEFPNRRAQVRDHR
jgi:hypothetical protein